MMFSFSPRKMTLWCQLGPPDCNTSPDVRPLMSNYVHLSMFNISVVSTIPWEWKNKNYLRNTLSLMHSGTFEWVFSIPQPFFILNFHHFELWIWDLKNIKLLCPFYLQKTHSKTQNPLKTQPKTDRKNPHEIQPMLWVINTVPIGFD